MKSQFNCRYIIKGTPEGVFENKVWGGFYIRFANDIRVTLDNLDTDKALSDKAASIKPGSVIYVVAEGIDSELVTKTSEIYSSDEAKILKPDAALNWCVRAGNEQSLSKDEYMYKKMFEAAQKNIKEIISYRGLEGNLPTEYALYQKTLSQCSTYNCRSLNSIGIARQLNGHERYTPTYDKKQAVDKITNAPSPAVNATATTPPVAPAMAASSELEKVDAAINAAWKALPAETRKAILPSQRAWIKEKDKCANEQCVIDMTKKRIDILQNLK